MADAEGIARRNGELTGPPMRPLFLPVAVLALIALTVPAVAQDLDGLTWSQQKCVLYEHAVRDAVRIIGRSDLRDSFLAANDAFIAGGCRDQGHICPVTGAEEAFAELLTVLGLNEGMSSTFLPCACPL